MKTSGFTAGPPLGEAPKGDIERQAMASLRGYAYQIASATLAWLDLDEKQRLFLEVAEDYAIVAKNALRAVQVKDTVGSGSITLKTLEVRDAIKAFVKLSSENPQYAVHLHYLTTSPVGLERRKAERIDGASALAYWRRAAAGDAIGPLRERLTSGDFASEVHAFVSARSDEELRQELLQRVHWDCGTPPLEEIHKDIEERLILLARPRWGIPPSEAEQLRATLNYQVLEKSAYSSLQERVLTRAALELCVEKATHISFPRAALTNLAARIAGPAFFESVAGQSLEVTASAPTWIMPAAELPVLRSLIPRPALENDLKAILSEQGAAFAVGASGLGKSQLVRSFASRSDRELTIVDCRDLDFEETCRRIDFLTSRLADFRTPLFLVDDVDHTDNQRVRRSLARLVQATRRRDRQTMFTSYRKPSAATLAEIGLSERAALDIPYFSEHESGEVVEACGGERKQWGRITHLAGGFGYPQLVHAFAIDMAARDWPAAERIKIVERGFNSEGTDAAREEARRSLVDRLSSGARTLLYRLTVILGQFDQATAVAIGSLPENIPNCGEKLDELVGPWIERRSGGTYRVSPLASKAGDGNLSESDRKNIHACIANQFLHRRTLAPNECDGLLLHGLLGKASLSLTKLAYGIVLAGKTVLSVLGQQSNMFQALSTEQPIFPDNLTISIFLRLAQFKVVEGSDDRAALTTIAAALLREGRTAPLDVRAAMEMIVLSTVLSTIGVANYLENWTDELLHFQRIVTHPKTPDLMPTPSPGLLDENGQFDIGLLFQIGGHGIATVERLSRVFGALDQLEPQDRENLLTARGLPIQDLGIFVAGVWNTEAQRETLNARHAARLYGEMASMAASWGRSDIAADCFTCSSVLLDEYCDDRAAAEAVLDLAATSLGENISIERQRAKIYWRHSDHKSSVDIMRGIQSQVGRKHPIERAFALRQAATSAAQLDDWEQAEAWFSEAQAAAERSALSDMAVMAIGLGADAAVAAAKQGRAKDALSLMASCLVALRTIDPQASPRAGYLHRVIRHTILWLQAAIGKFEVVVSGEPAGIVAGCCSNPDPDLSVLEQPLPALDLAWYMLRDCEILAAVDAGIGNDFHAKLVGGPILMCEIMLQSHLLDQAIRAGDAIAFTEHLQGGTEALVLLREKSVEIDIKHDVANPSRGMIPSSGNNFARSPLGASLVAAATLRYLMLRAFERKPWPLDALARAVRTRYGNLSSCLGLLDIAAGRRSPQGNLSETVAAMAGVLASGSYLAPSQIWEASLRIFEHLRQTPLSSEVMPAFTAWMRREWTGIAGAEAFRLTRPAQTVPRLRAALENDRKDQRFIATLLLAADEALGGPLSQDYRQLLETI